MDYISPTTSPATQSSDPEAVVCHEKPSPEAAAKGTNPAAPRADEQMLRLSFPRLMAAYLCLCLCYFVSYLDMNSITTSLPTLSYALEAGPTITWAGTAYLLSQTSCQPLYGRVSDIWGRKPVLVFSVLLVGLGSLLSGLARSAPWLYAARALNGVGGGGISSLVAIVVGDLVSLKDRGKYQGLISVAIGTGAMSGPFVAAALVRSGPDGWRWTFWVPAILAAVCLVLLLLFLPQKPVTGSWKEKIRKIDWFGVASSVAGIVLLLIPISSGGSIWPWRSAQTISLLVVGATLLIVFVLIEAYIAKLSILPLRILKERSCCILLVQGMLHDFVWQGAQYFIPLYFQTVRGFSPMQSATLIMPFLLAQSIAGAISGPTMSNFARYSPVLRFGFALWTLGTGLRLLFDLNTSTAVFVTVLVIEGAGVGFVHQPGLVALQALSLTEDRAVATSTRNLLRSLGGVAGVAVPTALLYAVKVLEGSWKMGEAETAAFESAILAAKMAGLRAVFILFVPLMGLCLVGSFFVADVTLQGDG